MNILYLSQLVPYPIDAGPKVRSYHVLEYLASAGHKITLVAFRRSNDQPKSLTHLEQFCSEIHTIPMVRSRLKDVMYLGKSMLMGTSFLIDRDSMRSMNQLILSLIRRQRFDAIHADQLWMAQYALRAQTQLNEQGVNTLLVMDQHNAVHLIPQRLVDIEPNPLKRWVLDREARSMKRYELQACSRFDHVVWVTDEDRQIIENASLLPIDSLTIPICVDPETKAEVKRLPNPRRVTFLGGLHWPPNAAGIEWFARAVWPKVQSEVPDAYLTVIGKNPPKGLQDSSITNLDVTGYVEDPEPLLADTAVFVVPLHAGGGMRVKIIDAWSWGLPVVSTTVGAEGIKYQDGEDIIIADGEDAFAQAAVKVLLDPALASCLRQNGRQKVETDYNWRITYKAWDQIYPLNK